MSRLGHSRRFDGRPATSGPPPSTDVIRTAQQVRFVHRSGLMHRSHCKLFDHLVRAGDERWRHVEADCLGGFEVYHQLELRGLNDRQLGRLLALEYPADIDTGLTICLDNAGAITDKAAGCRKFAEL